MAARPPHSAVAALKQSLIAGLIALLLSGPLAGVVLDGLSFKLHLERPLWTAAAVMLLRFVIVYFGLRRAKAQGATSTHATASAVAPSRVWGLAMFGAGLGLAVIPFTTDKYTMTIVILSMIYVLLGLGLNIVVGLAGLLDLGFVGFYAIGAYTYALGAQYLGLGFWGALPLAAFLAASMGVVLGFPVLRMHGDYLAIVTLGFGEIIRLVLNNWLDFTGGPNGVRVPSPSFFGLSFARSPAEGERSFHEVFGLEYSGDHKFIMIYLVLLATVGVMIYAVQRLKQMPLGRAWEALREDEIACRSLGINHVKIKLAAFATGAMTAGLAGVFFATYQGFVNPTSFTFFESALILAIVVLGGLGSTTGVVLAAFFLTLIPEFLRELAEYRVLLFGILMVVVMILKPRGLIRAKRPLILRPGQGAQ